MTSKQLLFALGSCLVLGWIFEALLTGGQGGL